MTDVIVLDKFGNYVKVGDKVAYATKHACRVSLRVGIVDFIGEAESHTKSWRHGEVITKKVPRITIIVSEPNGLPHRRSFVPDNIKRRLLKIS